MELKILIDYTTIPGSLSRLVKILKEQGFTPRIISPINNTVRTRIDIPLNKNNFNTIKDSLENIQRALQDVSKLWDSICVEAWLEKESKSKISNQLVNVDNELFIYTRRGYHGKTIHKLIWYNIPHLTMNRFLPESLMRKCIDSSRELDKLFNYITKFLTYVIAVDKNNA